MILALIPFFILAAGCGASHFDKYQEKKQNPPSKDDPLDQYKKNCNSVQESYDYYWRDTAENCGTHSVYKNRTIADPNLGGYCNTSVYTPSDPKVLSSLTKEESCYLKVNWWIKVPTTNKQTYTTQCSALIKTDDALANGYPPYSAIQNLSDQNVTKSFCEILEPETKLITPKQGL